MSFSLNPLPPCLFLCLPRVGNLCDGDFTKRLHFRLSPDPLAIQTFLSSLLCVCNLRCSQASNIFFRFLPNDYILLLLLQSVSGELEDFGLASVFELGLWDVSSWQHHAAAMPGRTGVTQRGK